MTEVSQQTQMINLINGLDPRDKKLFQGEQGEYLPITEWSGLHFYDGKIDRVEWRILFQHPGSIDLTYLPSTVSYFEARNCELESVGDISKLSESLQELLLSGNQLTQFFLKSLPWTLKKLDLGLNLLDGWVNFRDLPGSLNSLWLDSNRYSGPVDFSELPWSLRVLDVSGNFFWGNIRLARIPRTLEKLDLRNNNFDGCVYLNHLPSALEHLSLHGNNFAEYSTIDEHQLRHLVRLTIDFPRGLRAEGGAGHSVNGPCTKYVLKPETEFINMMGRSSGLLRKKFCSRDYA